MATLYAPMPKKPMCPTDSNPVNPTTRFRLTARIAQMAKTVPIVMAKPNPCQMTKATTHTSTMMFAHSSTFPFASRGNSLRVRPCAVSSTALVVMPLLSW